MVVEVDVPPPVVSLRRSVLDGVGVAADQYLRAQRDAARPSNHSHGNFLAACGDASGVWPAAFRAGTVCRDGVAMRVARSEQ